jgi:hypothetical protein
MEPAVRIKVGSIHSVKGETHLATLVLDTHYKGSHLTRIKDWLTGARSGLTVNKPELRKSLKQHYVAVTRPSHLLCLAMRSDAFKRRRAAFEIGRTHGAMPPWRVMRAAGLKGVDLPMIKELMEKARIEVVPTTV